MPWTLSSLAAMMLAALATSTYAHPPSQALVARWGFSAQRAREGAWWPLLTANYFVDHPDALLSSLTLVALFIGLYEYRFGPWWAASVWFAGTLSASVLAVPLWWLLAMAIDVAPVSVVTAPEVGASAAAWCALGAWLGRPTTWQRRQRAVAFLAAVTLLTLLAYTQTFTSVEHLVAFMTGMLVFGRLQQRMNVPARPYSGDWQPIGRALGALTGLLIVVTALLIGPGTTATALIVVGITTIGVCLTIHRIHHRALAGIVVTVGLAAMAAVPSVSTLVVTSAAAVLLAVRGDVPSRRPQRAARMS